ncbi:unnamed protein product [marine sediment metagenome]|uniref:Uncharacterized protein n=1 Tax=marine sediment metagenome TaxID=412755 RepID=X1QB42_9ZZZZ
MNSDKNVVAYFERVPVPVEGTITRKELDYQDIWQALPLYNIPAGTRTRVRITGRNDTSETQRMGIYWFVADPDGEIAQEYSTWEAWPYTGPGAEIPFTGSGFDLDKPGKYTIWVELIMNPGDPEIVDRYIGDLCTVEAVVEEYAGTLTRKELDYDAVRVPFPVQ